MECPHCGKKLIETNSDGVKKLRTRLLLFEPDGTKAICPVCKAKVLVPILLDGLSSKEASMKHVILKA